METLPTLLLMFFLAAFILMIVSVYCLLIVFKTARLAFLTIYKSDSDVYKSLLKNSDSSWLERGTYSVKDFSLWYRLYFSLYKNAEVEEIIGIKIKKRFVFYSRLMLASAFISITVAIFVLAIGWLLARG